MLQKELELCHKVVDVKPTQNANRYRVLSLRSETFLTNYVYAEMISSRLELHIQQEMIKSLIASRIGFNAKFMFNGYTALETSYGDDCPEKIKGLICANDNLLILSYRNFDKLKFPVHVVEKYTNSEPLAYHLNCGERYCPNASEVFLYVKIVQAFHEFFRSNFVILDSEICVYSEYDNKKHTRSSPFFS